MDSRKDMTKRLIADGFKALMLRYPFEKISIMMITNEAGIRRPSFYNHFQDKYDLLAWIVETDVIAPAGEPLRRGDGVVALRTIFAGLVEDAAFYRKAFTVTGQNGFEDSFTDAVQRLLLENAALTPAAPDFRIFWDNAYVVHTFEGEGDHLLNIFDALAEVGKSDMVYEFGSTAKVTFPSSGIAFVTASSADMAEIRAAFSVMRVSPEKVSQLAHVRFLKDLDGIKAHMEKHAQIVRPRFELVQEKLHAGLDGLDCATWSNPHGGYFVSFDGPKGSAKAIVGLAAELGVKLTPAGATWPYGRDSEDTNIRIAPTYPSLEDLGAALDVFVVAVKLVSARLAKAERDGQQG